MVLGAAFVTNSKADDNNESDKYTASVDFPYSNLENKIRSATGKTKDEITDSELFEKDFVVSDARYSQVKDITGLEYWDKYTQA
jgi:hypothetical protein